MRNDDENDSKWYDFVVEILEESIKKFQKSTRLKLMISYIYMFKLKNKWRALQQLFDLKASKPNTIESFQMQR